MPAGPQRPPGDIGSDLTVEGSRLPTAAPPGSTASGRVDMGLQRELPAEFDRSGLSERERDLVISRYRLLSRLGAGGMGLVYLAYDPSLDRKVAVKLLRPAGDDREPAAEAQIRLHREAQALAKLSHPNVVAVYDVGTYDAGALYGTRPRGESGDGVFLVMEYIEGVTLQRWLEQRPRSWQEIVDAYIAAGRGLVAAHAVGVIHRDFKPSNVLVRPGGSVHVFDFGLARAAGDIEAPRGDSASEHSHDSWTSSLSSPRTQWGAFVGTPAYMAPEQRGGGNVDERSDQFSFCVALYEALCGNRPFSGDNVYAIEMAKVSGAIEPPSRPLRMPRRVLRAVVRGLAADPRRRWPTLPALLAELDGSVRRRRNRVVAGVVGVALLGAAAGGFAINNRPVCTGAAAAFADAWDPTARAGLARSFTATGLGYAADTADRVAERLDDYRQRWLAGHTDACEATNLRRTQSPALMDARMLCLEQRRDELTALLAVYAAADADVVEHAIAAVADLPPVETCADLVALARAEPPAADPEQANARADLRRRLAAARAERAAGRFAAGRDLARDLVAAATDLDDRSLRAEAEATLGITLQDLAEHAEAERTLLAAYFDAIAAGRDELAADTAIALALLIGDALARPPQGLEWVRHADALLDRLGRPATLVGEYHDARGSILARTGDYAEAELAYRAAITAFEAVVPRNEVALAGAYANLSSTLGTAGKAAESLDLARRALDIRTQNLGPAHPGVASVLYNMGNTQALLGDFAAAESAQSQALEIWRASLPPRHERLAFPLSALGDIAAGRAQFAQARAYYEEARLVWETHFGPDYPSVIVMEERVAAIMHAQGDLAPARVLAERAVRAWERVAAPDPGGLTLALLTRSQIAFAEGQVDAARGFAERARGTAARAFGEQHLYTVSAEILLLSQQVDTGQYASALPGLDAIIAGLERDYGPDARWLAEPLLLTARARNALGQHGEARRIIDRVRDIAARNELPTVIADADLALAHVLWDSKADPAAARAHAQAAADAQRRFGAARPLADAEAWLAAHPLPSP